MYILGSFTYFSDFGKVFVAFGVDNKDLASNSIEVIDLDSSQSKCDKLSKFPDQNSHNFGGLWMDDQPIICGSYAKGKSCRVLVNGSWQYKFDIVLNRTGAAVLQNPPFSSRNEKPYLLVTGGLL